MSFHIPSSRDADVNAVDGDNQTPLVIAAANGNAETVSLLLRYKADLHINDSCDKSAIFWAAEENCLDVLEV